MDESVKKKVDESWKEQAEREKHQVASGAPTPPPPAAAPTAGPTASQTAGRPEERARTEELPQARLDLFVSGMAMEAFVALGDMPHPTTRRQAMNLPQAKYLIDLLGVLEEKTKGNLSVDEEKLLKDALYQLRMRYLTKAGAAG